MQIKIASLRAAGLSSEQIVTVIEHAETEAAAYQRERNRVKNRAYRQRKKSSKINDRVTDETVISVTHKEKPNGINGRVTDGPVTPPPLTTSESNNRLSKEERERGLPMTIPADWHPNSDGLLLADRHGLAGATLALELERFRYHYLGNGRLAACWDAMWAKWVISPYQKGQAPNGHQQQIDGREQRLQDWSNQRRAWREAVRRLGDVGGAAADGAAAQLLRP